MTVISLMLAPSHSLYLNANELSNCINQSPANKPSDNLVFYFPKPTRLCIILPSLFLRPHLKTLSQPLLPHCTNLLQVLSTTNVLPHYRGFVHAATFYLPNQDSSLQCFTRVVSFFGFQLKHFLRKTFPD